MIDMQFEDVGRDPDAAARRLMQRAHNQDGLPEIAIGVTFLATAGLLVADMIFPPASTWHRVGSLVFGLGIPALILTSQWSIKKLRRHFLIERVGYVELPRANRKRIATIIGIAFVVGAGTALALSKGAMPPASWFVAGLGIGGGALAAYAGKIPRFVVGGVIMALVGMVVGLCRVSLGAGQAILYGVMGVLSLCSGVVVLVVFLRKRDEAIEG